jgi:TetR/AcrR family transcriptional repressor of lmrAB and yxaGH operons
MQSRGPTASGVADIIAEAGAPRGSVYHHFPGGKDEILIEAIDRARAAGLGAIAAACAKATSADNLVERVARAFRAGPEAASWASGCPVGATAVEGEHQSASVREVVGHTFDAWSEAIENGLIECELAPTIAKDLAETVVAAIEGRYSPHARQLDPAATMRRSEYSDSLQKLQWIRSVDL